MAFHWERLGGADLAGLPFVRKTDLRERTLLALEELAPHYQLVVDRAATLARLEVQVEPAPALIARCGGFAADHPEITSLGGAPPSSSGRPRA